MYVYIFIVCMFVCGDLMLISKGAVEGVIHICIYIYSVYVCVWWFDAHFEGSGGGGNIYMYIYMYVYIFIVCMFVRGGLMLILKGAVEGVIYICIYVCIYIYSVYVCVW